MVCDHWIGSHDEVVWEALVQLGELRRGYHVSCIVRSSKVSNTSLALVVASKAMLFSVLMDGVGLHWGRQKLGSSPRLILGGLTRRYPHLENQYS